MSRLFRVTVLLVLTAVFITSCNGSNAPDDVNIPVSESVEIIISAEDAEPFGNVRLSGRYLEGFEQDGDKCIFTVEVPSDGFYDLNFISAGIGGYKENRVSVNGESIGVVSISVTGNDFGDSVLERVYLTEGLNIITYEKYWGWVRLKELQVTSSAPLDRSVFDVSARLINPNASDRTKRLMSYLADSYGEKILSGQYSDDGLLAGEAGVIFMTTGKRPAVLGLDMMDYTPSRTARGTTSKAVEHAITADEHGGIVTFCWHWNAPEKYFKPGGTWYRAFYTDETNINLKEIMNGNDPEGFDLLMSDIDAIAVQLQRLQDADVPILWRPLHEAAGGWFWWGA
ncbi:MAG: beta-mannosidase, partial [Oscillospiraceae bacterium]|nr:beta-mannosidase [Oscillospiraceae bacterium]